MIINYLESTLDDATASPYFTISWATAVSHSDNNGISFLDVLIADFLNRIVKKGYLNNTILILMGNHG
jgi:membrane-anchored protein YejM (alkaline phosphatase superfamily)